MTFVEHRPEITSVSSRPTLGDVACNILSTLDTLTLGTPNGIRFGRAPFKTTQRWSRPALQIGANHLLNDGKFGWNLMALRTDDGLLSNEGRFVPDATDTAYSLGLHLLRHTHPTKLDVIELIAVDFVREPEDEPPSLRYVDSYDKVPHEKMVEPEEVADSYQFMVLRAVANELQREADALIHLTLDLPLV